MIDHRLIQRLGEAHKLSSIAQILKETINNIEIENKQYMAHAKSKRRKIKSGKYRSSPKYTLWIKGWKTYRSLMVYHAAKQSK